MDGASYVSQYITPALAYQQWFSLNLPQQQQQQQQQQAAASAADNTPGQFGAATNDQGHFQVGYLDGGHGQSEYQQPDNGISLNLSSLQSFASSLSQNSSIPQTFMIQTNPNSQNGQFTILPTAGYGGHNGQSMGGVDHHQHLNLQQVSQGHHGQSQQAHSTPSSAVKTPKGRKPKNASVTPAESDGKPVKPAKPKGTPNAYALFYKQAYSKLRADNPEWKASQIMAEAGKLWQEMNGELQNQYREQAKSMAEAHQLLTGHGKASHKKQKNGKKRNITGYQLYIQEQFNQRPANVAQMHAKDFLLQLSGQWKTLQDSEKQVYQEKAKLEKIKRESEAGSAESAPNGLNSSAAPNLPADFKNIPLNGASDYGHEGMNVGQDSEEDDMEVKSEV
ncbi:hypothetical protein RvY_19244 [Ramazzottius varieornatus]|uniref:HMG box domain-containing protein n=1 Tax=Ramazzottius varieornatus TaxID=947166 RepID=A0A1D1WAS7_RAMVA|nr:hypothetical protein RvY_19244 [Ramazzottius varieornatus]